LEDEFFLVAEKVNIGYAILDEVGPVRPINEGSVSKINSVLCPRETEYQSVLQIRLAPLSSFGACSQTTLQLAPVPWLASLTHAQTHRHRYVTSVSFSVA